MKQYFISVVKLKDIGSKVDGFLHLALIDISKARGSIAKLPLWLSLSEDEIDATGKSCQVKYAECDLEFGTYFFAPVALDELTLPPEKLRDRILQNKIETPPKEFTVKVYLTRKSNVSFTLIDDNYDEGVMQSLPVNIGKVLSKSYVNVPQQFIQAEALRA